jgi:hypothetical protein
MDCEKIIEIYNKSCTTQYIVEPNFLGLVHANQAMATEQLKLDADRNCLKSIDMFNKYCVSEIKNKNLK